MALAVLVVVVVVVLVVVVVVVLVVLLVVMKSNNRGAFIISATAIGTLTVTTRGLAQCLMIPPIIRVIKAVITIVIQVVRMPKIIVQ